jgi:hypothetical protein
MTLEERERDAQWGRTRLGGRTKTRAAFLRALLLLLGAGCADVRGGQDAPPAGDASEGFVADASHTPSPDARQMARLDAGATPIDAPDGATDGEPRASADATTADCRVFVLPQDCAAPTASELPDELRCTGLYGDWAARQLACGVSAYQPAFQLWSDGADKHRYVSLPEGTTIDVSDPDEFVYPVGTQFWKEFRLQTASGLRPGETRLLRKTAAGWLATSYVWSEDGTRTRRTDDGVEDLLQTGHTVPSREQCQECHAGRTDFVLGWDWLMLGPGATGITRDVLGDRGLLRAHGQNVRAPTTDIPGDAIERAALGYLHANCGVSCHHGKREGDEGPGDLSMRLEIADLSSVQTTDAVRTGVNHAPNPFLLYFEWRLPQPAGGFLDFRPGDPQRSFAIARMSTREPGRKMPRLGSNRVDPDGVRIISDWVQQMSVARGYPAAKP